jgi:DNA-binding MarR family transcriptional regulator
MHASAPATKCACVRARRAARSLTGLYDRALSPARLKITQFSALRTIQRLQPVNISRLADEMALERSALGRNLSLLRRRGLVRFSDAADMREWAIELAPKGDALLEKALPLWQAAQAKVERVLGKDGVATLFALLHEVEQGA